MDSTFRCATVIAAALLLPASLAPALASPPPGVRVPLEPESGGWAVGVEVGGRQLRLLLDTGSSRSYVRREVAVSLNLKPRARFEILTPAGSSEGLCAGPVPVRLGDFQAVLDCLGWRAEEGPRFDSLLPKGVDGLLGTDAFANAEVLIDPSAGWLRVAGAGMGPWVEGTQVAAGVAEGRFWVELGLAAAGGGASRPLRLVIDSGAEDLVLFGAAAREFDTPESWAGAVRRLETLSGARAVRTVRLAGLGPEAGRPGGVTALLRPEARDRPEDGLVPLDRLGAVFLDAPGGRVVLHARLRTTPRTPVGMLAAR